MLFEIGEMPTTWSVTTAPASEPVTTAEAKAFANVEISSDDTLIDGYIKAAREYVERVGLARSLMTQTITLKLDMFPETDETPILLPQPPVQSVTSISYVDTSGTTQAWSSSRYSVDTTSEPCRIVPAWGFSWPGTRYITNAVTVVYVAGYANAGAVPETIKTAIKFLACHWYQNREPIAIGSAVSNVPWTVQSLLETYSNKGFA